MLQAVQSSKVWFKSEAVLAHDDRPVQLSVHLYDYSIASSFLYIEDAPNSFCFIPITTELIPTFSYPNRTFTLQFARYGNISLTFKFKDLIDIEQMVSHFGKTSLLINTYEDQFTAENISYLRKLKGNSDIPNPPKGEPLGDSTALLPLSYNSSCRDIWEKRVISQNSQFYIDEVPLTFNFLTWNVASNEANDSVLTDLTKVFYTPSSASDIVIIALQEIDMSFKSVVTGNSSVTELWTKYILKAQHIASNDSYEIIAYDSMGGVYCCVLVRKGLNPPVKESSIQTKKLGANGMLANKAAVYFRMTIGETSFVIISCHLAPHDQNWEQRNTQWHEIISYEMNSDYIIFMGDLNYRIALTYDEVLDKINANSLDELYEKDQLHITQQSDIIINEFKEPKIIFNPTFKYDLNSNVYDTSPKHRIPSWTDRILIRTSPKRLHVGLKDVLIFETDAAHHFMSNTGLFVTDNYAPMTFLDLNNYPYEPKCLYYRSLKSTFSDHRPVQACYRFGIPIINEERKNELMKIIDYKFDELRLLTIPSFNVSVNCLDSSISEQQEIVIRNNSLVWVIWKVKKDSIPKNLYIAPIEGMLMVKEETKIFIRFNSPLREMTKLIITAQRGKSMSIQLLPKNWGMKVNNECNTDLEDLHNPFGDSV
ncbi:Endonuclease/Exonuclease/phosphatase family protein [Histomonas meleagridis]|uniref:Endonuclease/Exonuclease/phosphatase family protein n=1 Tax=Histomonas meleagridis TaxID=135588 RepID=UPI0035598643|nr:Endonuclease/Exonuclease/phosphatase family protein [Histomonas meleagridis]KAH0801301.1 Endonuclease/Exonuclease/phosphatase family protein [Histomonas meleagridis]